MTGLNVWLSSGRCAVSHSSCRLLPPGTDSEQRCSRLAALLAWAASSPPAPPTHTKTPPLLVPTFLASAFPCSETNLGSAAAAALCSSLSSLCRKKTVFRKTAVVASGQGTTTFHPLHFSCISALTRHVCRHFYFLKLNTLHLSIEMTRVPRLQEILYLDFFFCLKTLFKTHFFRIDFYNVTQRASLAGHAPLQSVRRISETCEMYFGACKASWKKMAEAESNNTENEQMKQHSERQKQWRVQKL